MSDLQEPDWFKVFIAMGFMLMFGIAGWAFGDWNGAARGYDKGSHLAYELVHEIEQCSTKLSCTKMQDIGESSFRLTCQCTHPSDK